MKKNAYAHFAFAIFAIGLSSLLLSGRGLANITVSPLSVDVDDGDVKGGHSMRFSLNVAVFGENTIEAYMVEVHQKRDGMFDFERLAPNDPDINTVRLDKPVQHVLRAQNLAVTGTLYFTPNLMRHKRFLGVYVVENPPKISLGHNSQGLRTRVAYLLNIHTPRTESDNRLSGSFNFTGLTRKNGVLYINGSFFNRGGDSINLDSEVLIRDDRSRLVETVKIDTEAAVSSQTPDSVVYARTEVDLQGPVTKITKPGVYNVSLQAKMNKKKSVVVSRKINVTAEMLDFSRFDISPTEFKAPYREGQVFAQSIRVENPQEREVIAVFTPGKVKGDGLTEAKWAKEQLVIPPKSSLTNSYSIWMRDGIKAVPRGAKVTVQDKASKQVLQETSISVTFVQPPKMMKSPLVKKPGAK